VLTEVVCGPAGPSAEATAPAPPAVATAEAAGQTNAASEDLPAEAAAQANAAKEERARAAR
jgi:hypothetical protein